MFFFTEKGNLPLKMDMHNYKTEILVFDDRVSNIEGENTASLLQDKDSIYRLQLNGKKLIEYKLKTNKTFVYDINESKGLWGNFSYMTIYNGCLYLFPGLVEKIIIIDLAKKEVISKTDLSKRNENLESFVRKDYYWTRGCRIDHELVVLFSSDRGEIFIYDLQLNRYEIVTLPVEIKGVIAICQAENEVYILDNQNNLYEWEPLENKLKLVIKFVEIYEKNYFAKLINTDTKIILLPCFGNDIYILDKRNNEYFIFQDYPSDFEYIGDNGWAKYFNECQTENNVYFPMRRSHYILSVDKKTGELKWIKPVPPLKTDRIRYYKEKGAQYFLEGAVSLEEYIDIVENSVIN